MRKICVCGIFFVILQAEKKPRTKRIDMKSSFNKDVALQAMLYILSKLGTIDMHRVSKILYFADGKPFETLFCIAEFH